MSHNKMLIDATHPEETRVVVLRGGRVEEFDYESAARKLLRGNIYLAKVTRVEPSLQAAFIDYGGNRHGFLAFNEIHPDYYQIPMADRQALIDEEARAEAEEEAEADARAEAVARRRRQVRPSHPAGHASALRATGDPDNDSDGGPQSEHDTDDPDHHDHADARSGHDDDDAPSATFADQTGLIDDPITEMPPPETVGGFEPAPDANDREPDESHHNRGDDGDEPRGHGGLSAASQPLRRDDAIDGDRNGDDTDGIREVAGGVASADVDQVGSEDALEEFSSRPRTRRRTRSYKIQEVIKRRQVILVQVVKEERGTKGAALTTYLSLAGRYTVLMPNTARGGGISRKISSPQDRKRLKAIAQDLEVPEGMGLIIRTAGAARTQQEIKRDFEYLLRLWESVRDMTLQSEAPSLVYEEGNLIKRSIRDLYGKDVDEIIVAGSEAHRDARDFMRMLMPSHAKNVVEYQAPEPLFTRFGIERQLNAMFSPYVTLRSGGYLVINQTEALVAVDVNSGKSTREFSIEETALNTNLEASDEIARQVKLRDLAGLIVVDFIDMDEKRNNRAVERRLKDALRFDRARIQLGRISHFGLMEMSRQRLRTGVLEGSTTQCPHCQGTGIIRSVESVALAVLRGLEDAVTAGARTPLIATTTPTVALYILNNKRAFIIDMEARLGLPVTVQGSDKLQGANYTIEKGASAIVATPLRRADRNAVNMDWGFDGEDQDADNDGDRVSDVEEHDHDEPPETPRADQRTPRREPRDSLPSARGGDADGERDRDASGADDGSRRKRRRRRRGGRRGDRIDGERIASGAIGVSDNAADGDDESSGSDPGGDRITFTPDDPADDDGVTEINAGAGDDNPDGAGDDGNGSGETRGGADGDQRRRGRRRGRRGGRRNRERGDGNGNGVPGLEAQPFVAGDEEPLAAGAHVEEDAGDQLATDRQGETPRRPDRNGANDTRLDRGSDRRPGRDRFRRPNDQPPAGDTENLDTAAASHEAQAAQVPEVSNVPLAALAPESRPESKSESRSEPKQPARLEPKPAPRPETQPEAKPEIEIPRHRQRAMAEPSEPKIERVVVRPDMGATEADPSAAEQPVRKGWWSRRFGGE